MTVVLRKADKKMTLTMAGMGILPIFAVRLKNRVVVLRQEIDFQNLVFENVDNSTSKILVRNKSRLLLHSRSKNGCAEKRKRSLKVGKQ